MTKQEAATTDATLLLEPRPPQTHLFVVSSAVLFHPRLGRLLVLDVGPPLLYTVVPRILHVRCHVGVMYIRPASIPSSECDYGKNSRPTVVIYNLSLASHSTRTNRYTVEMITSQ